MADIWLIFGWRVMSIASDVCAMKYLYGISEMVDLTLYFNNKVEVIMIGIILSLTLTILNSPFFHLLYIIILSLTTQLYATLLTLLLYFSFHHFLRRYFPFLLRCSSNVVSSLIALFSKR